MSQVFPELIVKERHHLNADDKIFTLQLRRSANLASVVFSYIISISVADSMVKVNTTEAKGVFYKVLETSPNNSNLETTASHVFSAIDCLLTEEIDRLTIGDSINIKEIQKCLESAIENAEFNLGL